MTSLEAVSSFIPSDHMPVSECLGARGVNAARTKVYEHYFGFREIRVDRGRGPVEQLLSAATGLAAALHGRKQDVRYVVHARTMPLVAPYPQSPVREVSRALGLGHANAFCLSQHACASALLAVELMGRVLTAEGDNNGLALVLAGEKAFTSSAQVITDTGVMGESAAAVLVRAGGERNRLLGYATHTLGEFHGGPWMTAERATEFQQVYAHALADVMKSAVEAAGLSLGEITLVLPHNVNRMSWVKVLKILDIRGVDRLFLENLAPMGHCFGADAFINYQTAEEMGLLKPGDHYLMTAVGLGATFSAMVFRR